MYIHFTTYLAQRKVAEKGRGAVRLPEGEGRGGIRHLQASPTVLGRNLSLEGPPVLWVCEKSLWSTECHKSRLPFIIFFTMITMTMQ